MKILGPSPLVLPLIFVFCGALIFPPGIAWAQRVEVHLDPSQTQIHFTLGATLHTVHGGFKLKSGSVTFDPNTGKASGEVVIDAASGNSENAGRDSKMHTTVLASARYPDIVFTPQQIQGHVALEGRTQAQIQGTIRLHGSEHAVTLPVKTQISGGKLLATLHFTIPYVQWGLKDPSTFILRVDKTVNIEVDLAGQITPAP